MVLVLPVDPPPPRTPAGEIGRNPVFDVEASDLARDESGHTIVISGADSGIQRLIKALHTPLGHSIPIYPASYGSLLRLAVLAPAFADADALEDRLDRLVAAYRPFALATGNALVSRSITRGTNDLRLLAPLDRPTLLNVRELAGLWHLPQAGDAVVFVERTTARHRLPLKHTVAPAPDGTALPDRCARSDRHPG
jgi:hypothetical protein